MDSQLSLTLLDDRLDAWERSLSMTSRTLEAATDVLRLRRIRARQACAVVLQFMQAAFPAGDRYTLAVSFTPTTGQVLLPFYACGIAMSPGNTAGVYSVLKGGVMGILRSRRLFVDVLDEVLQHVACMDGIRMPADHIDIDLTDEEQAALSAANPNGGHPPSVGMLKASGWQNLAHVPDHFALFRVLPDGVSVWCDQLTSPSAAPADLDAGESRA